MLLRNNESLKTAKLTANYTVISDPRKAEADLPILYFLLPWGMEASPAARLTGSLRWTSWSTSKQLHLWQGMPGLQRSFTSSWHALHRRAAFSFCWAIGKPT